MVGLNGGRGKGFGGGLSGIGGQVGGFGGRSSRCWEVGIGAAVAALGGGLELGRWVTWYGWGKGWSKGEVSPGGALSKVPTRPAHGEPVEPRARPSTGSGRADRLQSHNFGKALVTGAGLSELGVFGGIWVIMGGDGTSFCHQMQMMHKKLGVLTPTGMTVLPELGRRGRSQ